MDYNDAVNTILSVDSLRGALMVILALAILFLVVGQVIKMWRDLWRPKDNREEYRHHLQESNDRFEEDERDIDRNRRDIADLKDGLRANCRASLALLNHAIHNGNTDEMEGAKVGLTKYLIDRN